MIIYGKSETGLVRSNNQDSFDYGMFSDDACWAIVCDGMGGASGGAVASSMCVEILKNRIESSYRENMSAESIQNMLESAIAAANIAVFERSEEDVGLSGMGTTLVAVIIKNHTAVIAHVGDSRAYIIRDDDISPVTKDHSVVQFMIDTGRLTPEEAKIHPDRNIITKAIGVAEDVRPSVDIIGFGDDETLLVCTDGLNGGVEDSVIFETVKSFGKDDSTAALMAKAYEAGANDNITVVTITSGTRGEE